MWQTNRKLLEQNRPGPETPFHIYCLTLRKHVSLYYQKLISPLVYLERGAAKATESKTRRHTFKVYGGLEGLCQSGERQRHFKLATIYWVQTIEEVLGDSEGSGNPMLMTILG